MTLGIRPEHITISPTQPPDTIPSQVYAVQPLGGEWLVMAQVTQVNLLEELSGESIPLSTTDVVRLEVPAKKIVSLHVLFQPH